MEDASPEMLSIFIGALERRSPEEQAAFLEAACGADVELRLRIEGLVQAHEQAGGFLKDRTEAGGSVATVDRLSSEGPGTVIGPFKLLEPIGEGGFGVVFLAEQTEPLRRKVALKVLKAGMDTRQVVARFEAERQALAIMDHPNIAKVFDGGATPSGRPYFVMELVKGMPITEFCDQSQLTPRQRLELFIPVCEAVQHAHQKGIIHRDLKPSNVLVSRHDTTPVVKVIDFGVAKALGQELTDKTLFTGIAQMVGTPLYMSPEQAGMSDLDVDTRSDVYSLGVLLYELLTGTTPFTKDRFQRAAYDEIRRIIREEDPPRPSTRLSESKETLRSVAARRLTEPAKLTKLVRDELDWIVMKALEKDRSRRYETASGFAMDVQRYLADEPVQACPPSAGYRLKKFVRRNKVGLTLVALALLFLVLLGSGAGWAVRDRAARHAKVAGQVESILAEVDEFERDQMWPEALAAVRLAEAAAASGDAHEETTERVRQRLKGLEFIDSLEHIRMQRAMTSEGPTEYNTKTDREYTQAFRDYGVDIDNVPVETAIRRLKTDPALAIRLAGALDEWSASRRALSESDVVAWKRPLAVASGIDPEPLRESVRATRGQPVSQVHQELRRMIESIDIRAQHATTLHLLARLKGIQGSEAAIQFLRSAQYLHPGDFWLNFELADALRKQGDYAGALRFHTAAVALRPNSAAAHLNLGLTFHDQKRLDEAIHYYRKAIELGPKYAAAYTILGVAFQAQKKLEEAIAAHRKAIELDPQFAGAYVNLGVVLFHQKKLDEAVAAQRKAIELDPQFAGAYVNLCSALTNQGKLDQAVAACRQAIELDPKKANAYIHLSFALRAQKKLDQAIAASRRAIELDPKNVESQFSLGFTLQLQKNLGEAVAAYKAAIELDPRNAAAYNNLGNVLREQRKLDEASAAFRKAIEIDPTRDSAYLSFGALLCDDLSDYGKAVECFRKAIELEPTSVAYCNLGIALTAQKKLHEAAAAYRKAIELSPQNDVIYNSLGVLLCDGLKDYAKAIDCFGKAIELDPKNPVPHFNLGNALKAQNKIDEAIACYRKTIELHPRAAYAYNNLGKALCGQKKLDEGIAALRKAIELDSRNADPHFNLGNALRAQKKWNEAAAAFRKAIELDPKFTNAYCDLGIALHAQKKLDEAIAAFRKAIELDPSHAGARTNLGQILNDFACTLATDPVAERRDLDRAASLAAEVVKFAPSSHMAWQYLGWILYRIHNWKSSIEALEKSCKLQDGGTGDAGQWIVLALAHAKLAAQDNLPQKEREHHTGTARLLYDQANKQIDTWWPARPGDDVGQAVWDLRAEARKLITAKESQK